MKPATLTAAAVLALAHTCAFAVDVPVSSRYDNRIQYVNYNAGDVVLVRALAGLGTRIVFGADEEIIDIASGFTQGWEFSDRRNILYIKPKSVQQGENLFLTPQSGQWDTNLMVTTNRHMYDFDLKLMPGSHRDGASAAVHRVAYRVQFLYPDQEREQKRTNDQAQATQAKLDTAPAPLNWNYSMQIGENSEGIAPTMAYDDGRFTYLRFPNNRDFPAAFLVAADKSESIVNSHIDPGTPDVLVVHRVAPALILRLGNAVVGVYNESYDADGLPPAHGTTVPDVQRVIKSGQGAHNE